MEKKKKLKLISQMLDSRGIGGETKPLYMHYYEIIVEECDDEFETRGEIERMIEEDLQKTRIVREGEKLFKPLLERYMEYGEFPLLENIPEELEAVEAIDATDDETEPTMFLVRFWQRNKF